MSFLQPLMLLALPLIAAPIIIHLINQRRYQTKRWGAMMFLLAANRMHRGFARIRQWLILALRTLAVAGLIVAVARPLSSGLLGWSGGGNVDTTLVLLDRSPSMQQQGLGGISKFDSGRRQLADALRTLGSDHWVAINSTDSQPQTFQSLDALLDSAAMSASTATAQLPNMLQSALDYLETNKPGPTEIWICSDLRQTDWNADSGTWNLIRQGFERLPQSVRFHLLAYPQPPQDNRSIRVTSARREERSEEGLAENSLLLSFTLARSTDSANSHQPLEIPVEIEIEGARSELQIEFTGERTEVRNHRIPLAQGQTVGWGRVAIPADENNADNEFYFVFDDPPPRRVVVVSDDRTITRPLEIAATVAADGSTARSVVDVWTPQQLDSLALEDASLLMWQAELPDASLAPAIEQYVSAGGQVIFFPPSSLTTGQSTGRGQSFMNVSWERWRSAEQRWSVANWRGDQDLLAATESGAGLPVGQLELAGHATLASTAELSHLATLDGGQPLLTRVPTTRGGVYFFTASVAAGASSLAESGVVLYVAVQRAIERGQAVLGNTLQHIAGQVSADSHDWRQIAGEANALSTEFRSQAGVYQSAERLVAINRAVEEDQIGQLDEPRVDSLFAGLPLSRVDARAGSLEGIVREVWRLFLIAMIIALLLEAILSLPRNVARRPTALGRSTPQTGRPPLASRFE